MCRLAGGSAEPLHTSLKNGLNARFHTDPLGTGPAMAIDAAVNIVAFDTNVIGVGAAVSPPFRRPEQANDRCAGSDGNMRRPGVAANVKSGPFGEFVKALQARVCKN